MADHPESTQGAAPHDSESGESSTRGTPRPFRWTDQPRQEGERPRIRRERQEDAPHQLRILWLHEVRAWIESTTEFKDHWDDPRWDDLPAEWEFAQWTARRVRNSNTGKLRLG